MTRSFDKSRLPSRHVSVGPERAPHRSYYYAMGISEEDVAKPFVALASAGNDSAPCRMRIVSFTSKAPLDRLIDYYYTQAIRNGFNAERQSDGVEQILAGARERDGSAYYLIFRQPKGQAAEVDMIVNHGR